MTLKLFVMKTYLSLNQLKPYYESTDQNIKALFGIYYLTNDINAAQQFYVNFYLCDALGMEKLPSFNNLLETLSNLGSQKIQVNLGKED
ncbi:uncharacterized protein METZ01_LOCUS470433, partial [marine metagenome]